jgi:hypothetical protein
MSIANIRGCAMSGHRFPDHVPHITPHPFVMGCTVQKGKVELEIRPG